MVPCLTAGLFSTSMRSQQKLDLVLRERLRVLAIQRFKERKMKRKSLFWVALCLPLLALMLSVPSAGLCQQGPAAANPETAPVREAARPPAAVSKPAAPDDEKAKAQTAVSPQPRKAEKKPMSTFDATEGCAGS